MNKLWNFLTKTNLYKFQSAFRKNHSIEIYLYYLIDKVSNSFDSGFSTGMVLIDPQKTHETINHYILLQKLPSREFSNKVVDWFILNLIRRKFHINVYRKLSTTAELKWGVPQVCILKPLSFLLYINYVIQTVDCDLFLYVDDTCLLINIKI